MAQFLFIPNSTFCKSTSDLQAYYTAQFHDQHSLTLQLRTQNAMKCQSHSQGNNKTEGVAKLNMQASAWLVVRGYGLSKYMLVCNRSMVSKFLFVYC